MFFLMPLSLICTQHVIDRNYDINITVLEGGSMKKSLQIDDFWKKYLDAVLKRSVPKDKAEWYLKWAQKFAVSAPGPLRSRSSDQIKAFLEGPLTCIAQSRKVRKENIIFL